MANIMLNNDLTASYDELADTLYLSRGVPKRVASSIVDENYVIVRKVDGVVCGITIDGFKDRHIDHSWRANFVSDYFPDVDIGKIESLIT
jgi:uncharacterized protein YuzE